MRKCIVIFALCFFALFLRTPAQCAESENSTVNLEEIHEYAGTGELVKNMPDNAKEYIDDGGSLNIGDLKNKFDFGFVFSTVVKILGEVIPLCVKDFLPVFVFIIFFALLSAAKDAFTSEKLSEVINFIAVICFAGITYFIVKNCFFTAKKFLEDIHVYMTVMMPVMASLSALTGNVTAAAANSAGLYVILNVVEIIASTAVLPLLQICYAITLTQNVNGALNLSGIVGYIKSAVNFIFIFIMTTMVTILFFQNTLASSADNIASRTVKFTVSSFVPVVGGIIGDAARTVIGSMQAVKNVTGVFGIFVIIITLLPPLITVLANKFVFRICGAFSLILGMDKQNSFLSDICSLLDITIALMISVSVVFIFVLTIFVTTAVAV